MERCGYRSGVDPDAARRITMQGNETRLLGTARSLFRTEVGPCDNGAFKTVALQRGQSDNPNTLVRGGAIPDRTPTKGECPSISSPSTKGLRNMSVKICQEVKEKGKTTCTAVADELIQVIKKEQEEIGGRDKNCDEKNVRRRVYDALNVLEAVNVITKNSKDISWKGMPSESHDELRRLAAERDSRKKKIKEKQDELRERLIQQITYRNLVRHNKRRHHTYNTRLAEKISLPFVVFNTSSNAEVHCDATRDLSHVMMDGNAPFALHDDNSILRQMGL